MPAFLPASLAFWGGQCVAETRKMPEYFRPLKAVRGPAADPGSMSTSDSSRYLAEVVIRWSTKQLTSPQ
jgi:hypothetical protein